MINLSPKVLTFILLTTQGVWLLPDNTIHMVTGKRQKLMKEHPCCSARFSKNIRNEKTIGQLHLALFRKCCGVYFSYIDYVMSNMHRSLFSFFGLVSTPSNIYLLVELPF